MPHIDLDMLAYDMAKMLDRYGYEIDASSDDIRPHLEEFIAKVRASAAQPSDEPGPDAASWVAEEPAGDPIPQATRRPQMTYLPWMKSQLVMMGATARDEHFWQCPTTGCKVWAGPYSNPSVAKQAGFEHVYRCEKTDYFRRGRQS
jgi:hypothetical protein